jgi:hypothetical protein
VESLAANRSGILLPQNWIGKQAYTVTVLDEKNNTLKQSLVLVPFADASQTEAGMKVWLPFVAIK